LPAGFADVEAFEKFLARTAPGYSPGTVRTYRVFFRRLLRDLSALDFFDPAVLEHYREALPQGTKNIFTNTWPHLEAFSLEQGVKLPSGPSTPRIRWGHPLVPDLLTLVGEYDVHRLPGMVWGDLAGAPWHVQLAAARIHEFWHRGLVPVGAQLGLGLPVNTPVLLFAGKQEPMRQWHLEALLNGDARVTAGPERASPEIASLLAHAGVNGRQLRACLLGFVQCRKRIVRAVDPAKPLRELVELVRTKDLRGYLARVERLAEGDETPEPAW
jgi:hypothetical protein